MSDAAIHELMHRARRGITVAQALAAGLPLYEAASLGLVRDPAGLGDDDAVVPTSRATAVMAGREKLRPGAKAVA